MLQNRVSKDILFFVLLTITHSILLVFFKISLVNGQYTFSLFSSICLTECLKLIFAILLNIFKSDGKPNVKWRLGLNCIAISCLYVLGNLLTFICIKEYDPGTLTGVKALIPYICAILLSWSGRRITGLQWRCIIIQCLSVLMMVPSLMQTFKPILISVVVTGSVSSVWNEKIIKRFNASLQQQNIIIYVTGMICSFIFFLVTSETGFFEGYDVKSIILIILQAIYGICIPFAYRHSTLVVKNLSGSATMGIMVFLSSLCWNVPLTQGRTAATLIISTVSYIYLIDSKTRDVVATPLLNMDEEGGNRSNLTTDEIEIHDSSSKA